MTWRIFYQVSEVAAVAAAAAAVVVAAAVVRLLADGMVEAGDGAAVAGAVETITTTMVDLGVAADRAGAGVGAGGEAGAAGVEAEVGVVKENAAIKCVSGCINIHKSYPSLVSFLS